MKKIYFIFLLALFQTLSAQLVPTTNPIQGNPSVCVSPGDGFVYSTSGSNNPTNYSWSVAGSQFGTAILGQGSSTVTIYFPPSNGTYTIFCSASNANGPGTTVSFPVTVMVVPDVSFSGASNICMGSSTVWQASSTSQGSSTFSYSWAPSFGLSSTTGASVIMIPTISQTYTLFATNGFCTSEATKSVTVINPPSISAVALPSVVCVGAKFSINITGSAASYSVAGIQSTTTFTATKTGTAAQAFLISGTDGNTGCIGLQTVIVNGDACVGIRDEQKTPKFLQLYPNPCNGSIYLRSQRTENVNVYDNKGSLIAHLSLQAGQEIVLEHLAPGLYFVVGSESTQKFIVQ